MKKENLEFRVGLFVVVSLGLLVFLVVKAGDFYLKPGYAVRFVFATISGVDAGSPVRLAGVDIGEVKEVHVVRSPEGQTQAEVIALINDQAVIEPDAEVRISSLGLLGEKYIEILPGTPGSAGVGSGGTVVGKPSVGLEKLADAGSRLVTKLEFTADNINEVVSDPAFKAGLKGTFVNANTAFSKVDKLSSDLMEASADLKDAAKSAKIVMARLRDGEGSIGRLLKDDTAARNLEAFTEEIRKNPWKLLKRN
jgi:phospholipid/cholesterol/gamma-HCH transport system substrate-binding protein